MGLIKGVWVVRSHAQQGGHALAMQASLSPSFEASELPLLPQPLVDAAAGLGDGVFNAITLPAHLFTSDVASLDDVRNAVGVRGVDVDSTIYSVSSVTGNLVGGTALYVGAAFTYVPTLGPASSFIGHPAYGGTTVRSLQSGLRFGWGRHNGPVLRFAYKDRFKVDILRR